MAISRYSRYTFLLLLVAAFSGPLGIDGFTNRALLQEAQVVVQPEVAQQLEDDSEVPVIISLALPAGDLADASLVEMQQNAATRQALVLSNLTTSDFNVTYQYDSVPALAGRVTKSGVQKLAADPDVLSVALDRLHPVGLAESVPLIHADDGGIQFLDLDGTGVTVAVLDSGIDTDHPDLADSIVGEACFLEANASDCPPGSHPAEDDWVDVYHGTRVSGIITSNGTIAPKGVAPGASIFAYKIIGGSTGGWSDSDMLAALNHIIGQPQGSIDFINMSLQSIETYPPGQCPTNADPDLTAINTAIQWLYLYGTLTFSISGNRGDKAALTYPGCLPYVVSVGAVTDRAYDLFNWGPCTDSATAADKVICFSDSSSELDLLAPGFDILTTSAAEPDLVERSGGTSYAAPHAVGVAALLKQALPGLTPDQIETRLKRTGKWVKDDFNDGVASTFRWTPRIDARVALLTNDAADYDGDACPNGREFGDDPMRGGQRNPLDRWDYYDVNLDGRIDAPNDILQVMMRYQANDAGGTAEINRWTDPLSPAPPPPAYHPRFDRGSVIGPNHWNRAPANDSIDAPNDILGVKMQYEHNCR